MTIYFYTLTFFFALGSFCYSTYYLKENEKRIVTLFIVFILIIISSLRWKVGGDWEAYYWVYERSDPSYLKFEWSFGFEVLNLIIKYLGLGIWGVNLSIILIFFFALNCLSKALKLDFFLLVLVFFSLIYFNIIMGYVRQSLSLSMLMFSIYHLEKNNRYYSGIFFLMSCVTHLSAIIFFPIWLYAFREKIIFFLIMASFLLIIIFNNMGSLSVQIEQFLLKNYISAGAYLRLIPIAGCVLAFLIFHKKIITKSKIFNFYLYYSTFVAIILIGIMFTTYTMSAFVDRLFVYWSFYQLIIVGSILKAYVSNDKIIYIHATSFVSIFYFVILFTWFLYGDYSILWLQYDWFGSF